MSGESVVRVRAGQPAHRRSGTFDVIIVDPLVEAVPPEWDAFVVREALSPLWTSDLIRTADWHAPTAASFALVRERGGDVVALVHARHLGPGARRRYARPGRMPRLSLTECRLAPGLEPGIAFAADVAPAQRRAAVLAFEHALRARTGIGGLGMAYRELDEATRDVVATRGRIPLRLSPCLVLANQWSDVDGYLRSRPGKWRAQLKKLHAGVTDDPGVRVELADDIEPDDAAWLAEQVRRRHHPRALPRPPLPTLHFGQLAARPEYRFLTYRDPDGRLLAFTAVLDTGAELVLTTWGSRAEADGGRPQLYFDQYLRAIELMITTGRPRLVLGKGMPEVKIRYGAHPEHRWTVVGPR